MGDDRVLLVASSASDGHDPVPGHPEGPERLRAVLAGAHSLGLGDAMPVIEPRAARFDELAAVHDPRYVEALDELCRNGGGRLDADTAAGPGSWAAATMAAGAGLEAVARLRAGEAGAAFGAGGNSCSRTSARRAAAGPVPPGPGPPPPAPR